MPGSSGLATAAGIAVLAICPSAQAAALISGPEDKPNEYPGFLEYVAAEGEANRLVVSEDADSITFSDPGAPIQVRNGCESPDEHTAVCHKQDRPAQLHVTVHLGDGDDSLRADLAAGGAFVREPGIGGASLVVHGGEGADDIAGSELAQENFWPDELNGGPGADRLFGRGGRDFLDGGAGGDLIDGGADGDHLQGRGHDAVPADDADVLLGGDGHDRLNYWYRFAAPRSPNGTAEYEVGDLHVAADGVANDGTAEERDDVGGDLEHVDMGAGADRFEAAGDLRSAHGNLGDDILDAAGAAGPTALQGERGNDLLIGGPARDALTGGDGNDRMTGGAGFDHLSGDEGDDWIDARDPRPPGGWTDEYRGLDHVLCGNGHDELLLDLSDSQSVIPSDGCDLVHAPVPEPEIPWLGDSGEASDERVSVIVGCPVEAPACTGDLVLKTTRGVTVARGPVKGKRGKRRRVSVPLTKAGRVLMDRKSRVETRARIKPDAEGARAVKKRLVLKRRG